MPSLPIPPPAPTPTPTPPTLTADELDDAIYFSRVGDLPSLRSLLTTLSATHNCAESALLDAAIDVDADGLGTRNTLLHWPAANGEVEVLQYLLSLIPSGRKKQDENSGSSNSHSDHKDEEEVTAANGAQDSSAQSHSASLVNHRNVNGNTALHWAALNGRLGCVKALVGAGADAGMVNEVGHDAVFEAEVGGREGSEEVVGWMLRFCGGLERGVGGGGDVGGGGVEGEEDEVDDVDGQDEGGAKEVEERTNGKVEDHAS